MPTVAEILAQMLDSDDGAEKTAETENQETKEPEVQDEYAKIAQELNLTPEEVEQATQELEEEEKRAEAEKKAEEAVYLGRFMARGFFDELQKLGVGSYGGVGGSEPSHPDQGAGTPQDGSVSNRVAEAIANSHGQKKTPKKEELKAVLRAARANFMVGDQVSPKGEPAVALNTESK
jgi:hypothetical protein